MVVPSSDACNRAVRLEGTIKPLSKGSIETVGSFASSLSKA